jgi:hypothetical protein
LADRLPVMFPPIVAFVTLASTADWFAVKFISSAETEVNAPNVTDNIATNNGRMKRICFLISITERIKLISIVQVDGRLNLLLTV